MTVENSSFGWYRKGERVSGYPTLIAIGRRSGAAADLARRAIFISL
jgi:hypothetical protein